VHGFKDLGKKIPWKWHIPRVMAIILKDLKLAALRGIEPHNITEVVLYGVIWKKDIHHVVFL
jgi:hypothetical protein